MSALPKPQPCEQRWLAMMPTANGRRCSKCEKEIYDFSAMSWPAIEQLQAAHGNALCGLYAPAQLRHWGQQPPATCAPLAAATALALALSSLPAAGQTVANSAAPALMLSGTVTTISSKGKADPVPGATVLLVGTNLGTTTDEKGYYQLAIPPAALNPAGTTLLYTVIGYANSYVTLPSESTGTQQRDVQLAVDTWEIDTFYVKLSLADRIKWRFKRWFSSEE